MSASQEGDHRGRSREAETSIDNPFFNKDLISADELTPEKLRWLFQFVPLMETIHLNSIPSTLLEGRIMIPLFFEASSRTRLSHQTAMLQLGGKVNNMEDPQTFSSFAKGAKFKDEILTYSLMGDIIVIRHPEVGSSRKAAEYAHVPVINAGDGQGEHPTQALLDLVTIWQRFGRLDNLNVVLGGDLYNGRTIHSLARLLANFRNNHLILVSPRELALPENFIQQLKEKSVKISQYETFTTEMHDADVWYWTRIQKERFVNRALLKLLSSLESLGYEVNDTLRENAVTLAQAMGEEDYNKLKGWGVITPEVMDEYAKQDMILMHPFPRVDEITFEVDEDPRAVYLHQQMRNGIYIRMALIAAILVKDLTPEAIIDSIPSKFQPQLEEFRELPVPNLGKVLARIA